MKRPQVFIGSSSEAEKVAKAIKQNLSNVAFALPWFYAFNRPGKIIIDEILTKAKEVDFAVFIFSPDDFSEIRGEDFNTVRDNVILEFGLFLGILGLDRCYIIKPSGIKIKMPTDLSGVIYLEYDIAEFEFNNQAGVSNATDAICERIDTLKFKNKVDFIREYKDDDELKEHFTETPDKK